MKWLKNLSAIKKLMAAFCGMLLFNLPIGYLALTQISELSQQNTQIYNRDVAAIDSLRQGERDQALIDRSLSAAVLSQGNSLAIQSAEQDFQPLVSAVRGNLNLAYSKTSRANIHEQIQKALALIPVAETSGQNLFARVKTNDRAAAQAALNAALLSSGQVRAAIRQAAIIKNANSELFKIGGAESIRTGRDRLTWLFFTGVLIDLLICLVIARSFSQPLKQAVAVLAKVESGDLTQRLKIDTTDEIGQLAKALNAALQNIEEVMASVNHASKNLTGASSQLAKSAEVLASGTQEQAASLEQTSASLEQITASVRQNSDNAKQASQFAVSSRDTAEKGGSVVQSAMSAMTEINEASGKIAAIIRAIDDIAFQTNLLAVNASVEAARAREHGKGFAVVATEVRTLAQRSGAAAKEIKALIGDSRRKVENGSTLVNRSGQTLADIVTSVKRVTDIVGEIASASREQSTGIEQVNSAMMQMDQVMQSNSSQTEELSATAGVLASQAAHLEKMIGRFVVGAHETPSGEPVREAQIRESPLSKAAPAVSQSDAGSVTTAALGSLAANLGHPVSTAALDEEFEEF
jgi:methyl-accepting chemotaxis protein